MIAPEEERHLAFGAQRDEHPGGAGGVAVTARCWGNATVVVDKAREVLAGVLADAEQPWPNEVAWREKLPTWFVEACATAPTSEEAARWLQWWRSLPGPEQARATREQRWTLSDWLFWLQPSERTWFWWDAVVKDPDTIRVIVEVPGWPSPLGALDWLLRAAGAIEVVVHDETATA